ncbi:beta-1,3-galactosyl-O-glycosyl-glycoprotein beta-1,6-N-acetylglucosaminyltransferase-like [Haliotis cracherodii]|uniref:beta-1,3-galactosyl-O-glycosyl-glycoprotein beta-1,6-N-acetylglucosaminyltransferase-like n=1 Tax=Haliotis cracherodii TaxID=6455 RepID=UPI0039E8B200
MVVSSLPIAARRSEEMSASYWMLRKMRRYWKALFLLAVITFVIYYIVYWEEDRVRNMIISAKQSAEFMFVPAPPHPFHVNCTALFQGNKTEIYNAMSVQAPPNPPVLPPIESCETFKQTQGYILDVSKEEMAFPIAFSILVYKNSHQAERLIRAVYRPSNVYCIHVDRKSTAMLEDMRRLAACFDNVFLSSRQVDVKWGTFSVLEPELICMEDVLKHRKWRYFINLTGQEFPLKTNYQLVKILQAYRGANDVAGTATRYNENIRRFWSAGSAPHGLRPAIGSVHIVVNRHFVNFSVHDPVAKDLQKWLRHTKIPDETYFPTLNYNPDLNIPGTFKGVPRLEPFLARYKNWDHGLLAYKDDCRGKYLREICVLGAGDVAQLITKRQLFANKFEEGFQPAGLSCLEEWYHDQTRRERAGHREYDTTFYSKLDFVLNQIRR